MKKIILFLSFCFLFSSAYAVDIISTPTDSQKGILPGYTLDNTSAGQWGHYCAGTNYNIKYNGTGVTSPAFSNPTAFIWNTYSYSSDVDILSIIVPNSSSCNWNAQIWNNGPWSQSFFYKKSTGQKLDIQLGNDFISGNVLIRKNGNNAEYYTINTDAMSLVLFQTLSLPSLRSYDPVNQPMPQPVKLTDKNTGAKIIGFYYLASDNINYVFNIDGYVTELVFGDGYLNFSFTDPLVHKCFIVPGIFPSSRSPINMLFSAQCYGNYTIGLYYDVQAMNFGSHGSNNWHISPDKRIRRILSYQNPNIFFLSDDLSTVYKYDTNCVNSDYSSCRYKVSEGKAYCATEDGVFDPANIICGDTVPVNAWGLDSNGYAIIGTGAVTGSGSSGSLNFTNNAFGSGSIFGDPSFDPSTFKLFEDDPNDGMIIASLKTFINFISAKIVGLTKTFFSTIFDKLKITSVFTVMNIFVPVTASVSIDIPIPYLKPDGVYLMIKTFDLPYFNDALGVVKIARADNMAINTLIGFVFAAIYLFVYYIIYQFLFLIFTILQRIWNTIGFALFQTTDKNNTGNIWIILFHWAHIIGWSALFLLVIPFTLAMMPIISLALHFILTIMSFVMLNIGGYFQFQGLINGIGLVFYPLLGTFLLKMFATKYLRLN